MGEIDELRQRRLMEMMQRNAVPEESEDQKLTQQIASLEGTVKKVLSKKALERYSNIKTAHPEKAMQVLVVIGQAIQQGQIKEVSDDALKDLLTRLNPIKKEMNIKRV